MQENWGRQNLVLNKVYCMLIGPSKTRIHLGKCVMNNVDECELKKNFVTEQGIIVDMSVAALKYQKFCFETILTFILAYSDGRLTKNPESFIIKFASLKER